MITLFSVSEGKFHRLIGDQPTRETAFRTAQSRCGLTLTPHNYFETDADAERHTGGKLARHLCKRCASPVATTPV